MPYYKAVKPAPNQPKGKYIGLSTFAKGRWQREYREGEWTEPMEGTRLFLYELEGDPSPLAPPDGMGEWTPLTDLWEVEVEDVIPVDTWPPTSYDLFMTYWAGGYTVPMLEPTPWVAAKRVRLIPGRNLGRRCSAV